MKKSDLTISFGSGERDSGKSFEGIDIAGYGGCVAWADSQISIPEIDENDWFAQLEDPPEIGTRRMILVKHPFNEANGANFWCFFTPALSTINGLDEHLEDVGQCAFVKTKILDVHEVRRDYAWLEVQVTECIRLEDAIRIAPVRSVSSHAFDNLPLFDSLRDFRKSYQGARFNEWEYYDGNLESDAGNWFLFWKSDEDLRLIAFGEWGFNYDCAYLFNVLLSDPDAGVLARMRSNANRLGA